MKTLHFDCALLFKKYPQGELIVNQRENYGSEPVCIDVHGVLTPEPLMGLLLTASALRDDNPFRHITLRVPYLPYSRADRRFQPGDPLPLRVLGGMFDEAFNSVISLDVHSDAASKAIRLDARMPTKAVLCAIEAFQPDLLLTPDQGAARRWEGIKFSVPMLSASKTRDVNTGAITGTTIPEGIARDARILVIDDICDGGATFIALARALYDAGNYGHLGLYTTHGFYSKGIDAIKCYYDFVACTGSRLSDVLISPWPDMEVRQ